MDFELIIKPIVFSDLDDIVCYYENRIKGLGKKFYLQFLSCLENIKTAPHHYSLITKRIRRKLIKKFPYKIFYLVDENTIYIIGISHAKRSGAFVKRRLKLL
jgi:hypothetical protein